MNLRVNRLQTIGMVAASMLVLTVLATTTQSQTTWSGPDGSNNIYYNAGNVGIGTSSPAVKLHVESSSATTFRLVSTGDNVAYQRIMGSTGDWYAGLFATADYSIGDITNSNATYLTIKRTSGNVGIGTAAPIAKLGLQYGSDYSSGIHIGQGSAATGLSIWQNDASLTSSYIESRYDNAGAAMYFRMRAYGTPVNALTLLGSGNVGIGTTSPAASLHIFSSGVEKIRFDRSGVGYGTIGITGAMTGSSADISIDGGQASTGMIFQVRNSSNSQITAMGINRDGYIGIGTASPLVKLHTKGTGFWESASLNGVSITPGAALQTIASDWNSGGGDTPLLIKTQGGGQLYLATSGNVGIGTTNPGYKLDVNGNTNVTGNVTVSGTVNAKYQDVAEWVESSEQLTAGTVVILDSTKSNQVVSSTQSYDTRVAGVISAQPGITLGEKGDSKVLVATTGRVKIKVDATKSPIQIGDLLVTSDVPGFAMKSEPVEFAGRKMHMPGTLIGKALEPLAKGKGEILVLLSLQ